MDMAQKLMEGESSLWFAFHEDKMLVKTKEEKAYVPSLEDMKALGIEIVRSQYLGVHEGIPCYSAELKEGIAKSENMTFIGLRQLYSWIGEEMFWLAGKAIQIVNWDKTYQFCGQCGTTTITKKNEYAKVCPACGLINYPRISPAIIVAVVKEDEILLAHSGRFTSKFYSVLAGFVEPGETLEACVKREVKEEVGIDVKNITYFGSQPWPFPNSLMIAFTAQYAGGEIKIDEDEITDAHWFSVGNLPQIPSSISIARNLIDWFIENHS